ncbi:MAG TPA: nucleotide disphospho-sugar-binding domain-containing protein [Thermoanaerobaculia bacterium]
MSRYVFAVFPVTGHVNPGLPIAAELVTRGHDVRWYSTPRFQRSIEGIGARFVPFRDAIAIDEERADEMFPARPKGGLAQLRFDIENLFVEPVRAQTRELLAELRREPADVLVGDNTAAVNGMVKMLTGTPWAIYGISPLSIPSTDTAPFGLALDPSSSPFGRLRNRLLYRLVDKLIFKRANELHEEIRAEFGLPRFGRTLFDFPRDADLYLQGSAPSFEYPRTDMPEQIRFVGASVPPVPAGWKRPSWWRELESGRKVVLLTQGTINNDYDQLIRPAIRALAGEEALIIVTTGSHPVEDVKIDPLPPNIRVERFVPYAALMPHVDLLVTNGGYGSIQIALRHGVPVVAIGKTEEKPEIVNRVEWSGVGRGIKVRIPSARQIRTLVREVLDEPAYRVRAEIVRDEMAGLHAARTSADLLEELAGSSPRLARTA